MLFIGKAYYHVQYPLSPLPGLGSDLGFVFPSLRQARFLQDTLQNHLTPLALLARITLERPGQILCLAAHLLVELVEMLQVLLKGAPSFNILLVGLLHLLFELLKLLTQRLEKFIQLLLVLLGEFL